MEFSWHIVKNGGGFRDFSDISENQAVARCKSIKHSLGFWIPCHGFPIPGTQCLNLDFEFQSLVGLRIADFKTRDSRFNKQSFPGFRISPAVRNPDFLITLSDRLSNYSRLPEITRIFQGKRLEYVRGREFKQEANNVTFTLQNLINSQCWTLYLNWTKDKDKDYMAVKIISMFRT